ncbi:MAG: hypothetical protein CM1200mP2_44080 [Planctomycetaceae bacterium]|nr:MAG: hypothetical protein CM1200mP2_44080 [Planctomycetaceae bacterium]
MSESEIQQRIRSAFFPGPELTPAGIIETLDLKRPIYRKTAAGGHFPGRNDPDFTWERTDRIDALAGQ